MRLNNYNVPQAELKVSVSTTFVSEDLSGETSSTATAHKGIKPKEISAAFQVKFDDANKLTEFYAIAEAVDDNGDLVVYEITERSANAVNVRQVQFTGRIELREQASINAWLVSFRLKEHLSVPEKTEQRQASSEATTTPTEGEAVAVAAEPEAIEPVSGFELVLKKMDDALA